MDVDVLGGMRDVVAPLLAGEKRATKYVSPSMTIKGTRRHRPRRGARSVEIVLTVGRPNYAEREFIRVAKKAGEPFPIRQVQIRPWRNGRGA